ncbi:hypothetical protein DL96DRAFT_1578937, partial [Flagelloscypha sp. PMI_526]
MIGPVLPLELLEACVDAIPQTDIRTLTACALAARPLTPHCHARLFRSVSLVRTKATRTRILPVTHEKLRCQEFLRRISSNPSLAMYVQNLDIFSWSQDCQVVIADILPNLRLESLSLAPLRGWLDWSFLLTRLLDALGKTFQSLRVLELAYAVGIPAYMFTLLPVLSVLKMSNCDILFGKWKAVSGRPGPRLRTLSLGGPDTNKLSIPLAVGEIPLDISQLENLIISVAMDGHSTSLLFQYATLCASSLKLLRCSAPSGQTNLRSYTPLEWSLDCPTLLALHLKGDHGATYSMVSWAASVINASLTCPLIEKIVIELTTFGVFESIKTEHMFAWSKLAEALSHSEFSKVHVEIIFTNYHVKIARDQYQAFNEELGSFAASILKDVCRERRLNIRHRLIGFSPHHI